MFEPYSISGGISSFSSSVLHEPKQMEVGEDRSGDVGEMPRDHSIFAVGEFKVFHVDFCFSWFLGVSYAAKMAVSGETVEQLF